MAASALVLHDAIRRNDVRRAEFVLRMSHATLLNTKLVHSAPLHIGVKHKSYDCVKMLLEKGAHIHTRDQKEMTPIIALCATARNDCTQFITLLEAFGCNLNDRDSSGWTPLHYCVRNKSNSMAEELLRLGAEPDGRDNDGDSALMVAVKAEDNKMVKTLLAGGANANTIDKDGK